MEKKITHKNKIGLFFKKANLVVVGFASTKQGYFYNLRVGKTFLTRKEKTDLAM